MTPTDFLLAPLRRVRRWILRPLDARITALTAENRALRASLEQVRAGLDEGLGTLGRTGIALRRHELAGEPAERSDATGRRQATEQDVSVSVVIVTYNRADALAEVLTLLRAQDHPAFEVVVVNGPSSDGTATILADRAPDAKVVDCPEKNIAAARNLGLAAAGGDVVAFLDDDTLPEPEWLGGLIGALVRRPVAGVGGPYRRRSGIALEHLHLVGDRLGETQRIDDHDPTEWYSNPWSDRFVILPGGNSAYRRDALIEVGGFDEAFEYGGEEGDLGIRLRSAGHLIAETLEPVVYHQALANEDRDAGATVLSRYRFLRSKAYFARKHGLAVLGPEAVDASDRRSIEEYRVERLKAIAEGRLDPTSIERYEDEARRAIADATDLWAGGPRVHDAAWFAERRSEYRPFRSRPGDPTKAHVCTVSVGGGGIDASLVTELRAAAADGHVARVITLDSERRIASEAGVWRHAVPAAPTSRGAGDAADPLGDELARIHARRPVTEVIVVAGRGDAAGPRLPEGVPVRRSAHSA